jgi:uncharacterized OsmC-like protein
MGVTMTVQMSGLTCGVTHGPSSARLTTVPPVDNGGDGTSFSPTDLLATALATCALSTMALVGAREGLPWGEASATVVKEMTGPPRRVGELQVTITMPREVGPEHRARLEAIALTCPVARSLGSEVKVPMRFVYP